MDRNLVAAVLACLCAGSAAASAQWLGPVWETRTVLTAEDLDLMRATVQRDIHGKREDTVATWSNPATGNSGSLTLLQKFARAGKSCERIEYHIRAAEAARPERYVFTSCLQPDGAWKLEP